MPSSESTTEPTLVSKMLQSPRVDYVSTRQTLRNSSLLSALCSLPIIFACLKEASYASLVYGRAIACTFALEVIY